MALTEAEAKKSMEAYAAMMESVSTDAQKVRLTPDVYIGPIGPEAVKTMAREILQNSLDNILKGLLPGSPIAIKDSEVTLSVDERTWEFQVIDHGSGIPFGMLELIFSQTHSGSSYHKTNGDFGAGKNGCGAAVTNFLSEYFTVETYVMGLGGHSIKFVKGELVEKESVIPAKKCKIDQGTITTWKPDSTVIGNYEAELSWQMIYDLFSKIICLAAIGTKLCFRAIDKAGKSYEYHLVNSNGLYQLLAMLTAKPLIAPISISGTTTSTNPIKKTLDGSPWVDSLGVKVLLSYDISMEPIKMLAFANTSPSISGTHMDGVTAGITKFFKTYMNKIFLANSRSKLEITDKDILTGLCVVIDAGHTSASYNAQAKEEFTNKDMRPFAAKTVYDGLEEWAKSNPNDLQKICKYLKDVGQARMSAENERSKVAANYATTVLSAGLPAKFVKANGTKDLELFLVEGDSAKGAVKQAADPECQAIYPLRGKSLPNAMTNTRKKVMESEEAQAIIKILRIEPADPAHHKPCGDISKCPYKKIIFLADADYDGYHINCLLLLFFIVYYPDLIKAGRVFRCVPPLYGAKLSNGQFKYFPDEISYVEYTQSLFAKQYKIGMPNKVSLTNKDITGLLFRCRNFADTLESAAKNVGLDAPLLEVILQNRMKKTAEIKKAMKAYCGKFIEVDTINGFTHIYGITGYRKIDVLVDQGFCNLTSAAIPIIDNEPHYVTINGETRSLYELCAAFRNFRPDVQRYKGLGENDPTDLAKTAVRPNSDRVLIQYTFADGDGAIKQIAKIREIDSNKLKFLNNLPEECKADFA